MIKLAPRFYGPYKISKRIGQTAYELALPPHSRIHPVFHVSQLKKATGSFIPSSLPSQVIDTLELRTTPAVILNVRYRADGALEDLIQWSELPLNEATSKPLSLLNCIHPSTLRTSTSSRQGYCYALHQGKDMDHLSEKEEKGNSSRTNKPVTWHGDYNRKKGIKKGGENLLCFLLDFIWAGNKENVAYK